MPPSLGLAQLFFQAPTSDFRRPSATGPMQHNSGARVLYVPTKPWTIVLPVNRILGKVPLIRLYLSGSSEHIILWILHIGATVCINCIFYIIFAYFLHVSHIESGKVLHIGLALCIFLAYFLHILHIFLPILHVIF